MHCRILNVQIKYHDSLLNFAHHCQLWLLNISTRKPDLEQIIETSILVRAFILFLTARKDIQIQWVLRCLITLNSFSVLVVAYVLKSKKAAHRRNFQQSWSMFSYHQSSISGIQYYCRTSSLSVMTFDHQDSAVFNFLVVLERWFSYLCSHSELKF